MLPASRRASGTPPSRSSSTPSATFSAHPAATLRASSAPPTEAATWTRVATNSVAGPAARGRRRWDLLGARRSGGLLRSDRRRRDVEAYDERWSVGRAQPRRAARWEAGGGREHARCCLRRSGRYMAGARAASPDDEGAFGLDVFSNSETRSTSGSGIAATRYRQGPSSASISRRPRADRSSPGDNLSVRLRGGRRIAMADADRVMSLQSKQPSTSSVRSWTSGQRIPSRVVASRVRGSWPQSPWRRRW